MTGSQETLKKGNFQNRFRQQQAPWDESAQGGVGGEVRFPGIPPKVLLPSNPALRRTNYTTGSTMGSALLVRLLPLLIDILTIPPLFVN